MTSGIINKNSKKPRLGVSGLLSGKRERRGVGGGPNGELKPG